MLLEGVDLIHLLDDLFAEQKRLYEEYEKRIENTAEAERKYQVLMRQRALLERDSGTPITFIAQFIRGDEDIAELRKQRDICEALEKITENKIVDIRKRIEVTNAQAQREWACRDNHLPVSAEWLE